MSSMIMYVGVPKVTFDKMKQFGTIGINKELALDFAQKICADTGSDYTKFLESVNGVNFQSDQGTVLFNTQSIDCFINEAYSSPSFVRKAISKSAVSNLPMSIIYEKIIAWVVRIYGTPIATLREVTTPHFKEYVMGDDADWTIVKVNIPLTKITTMGKCTAEGDLDFTSNTCKGSVIKMKPVPLTQYLSEEML